LKILVLFLYEALWTILRAVVRAEELGLNLFLDGIKPNVNLYSSLRKWSCLLLPYRWKCGWGWW